MKSQKYKYFICWGITAFLVIAACIAFAFLVMRQKEVKAGLQNINNILAPITYGAVLAYLMTPVYNWGVKKSRTVFAKFIPSEKMAVSLSKGFGTVISLLLIMAVVVGLFSMLFPQIRDNIYGVIDSFPENADKLYRWLQNVLADNPDLEKSVLSGYKKGLDYLDNWMTTDLTKVMSGVLSGVLSGVVLLKNLLIGLIVMVYLLNIKGLFAAQSKKAIYSFFSIKMANKIIDRFRYIHQVFGGFIIGKLLDSLIIGIICFVCMSVMNMPYVLLISVIIGVTNIIPFFGPFIGAVPSAILVLMVNPLQCVYFLIFVLILQQFDGNILGPKILGDSTGLSSFWVLFSILVFGGLLGFVGMIIGVPTFAVIYSIISEKISDSLQKKSLSTNTDDYWELDYIDEDKKTYIK